MALYDALRVSPTVDFAAELLHDRGSDEIATLLEECGIGSGPELLARLRGPPPGDDDVNARVATLKETSGRVRDEIVDGLPGFHAAAHLAGGYPHGGHVQGEGVDGLAAIVAVPQAPGYWGAFQVAVSSSLMLFGAGESFAKASAILFWAVSFVPVTVIGLLAWWRSGYRAILREPPEVS